MKLQLRVLRPRSITQKILATILLISSVVTLFITAFQITFDYYQEISSLKKSLTLVENSYSRSIVASLWELNESQIQTQLDGIISIPGIEYAAIIYKNKTIASAGIQSERFINKSIELIHQDKESSTYLGQLDVHGSKEQVLEKILNRVFIIFISQFIKTLLVSAFLFFSIQHLVTRHLVRISSFVKNIDLKSKEKLDLARREILFSNDDELNVLVGTINEMREKLSHSYEELQELNSEQRKRLEFSSRMSSLGEMAGGIAHEINNPLTVIGSASRLIRRNIEAGENSPERLFSFLDKIDKTTERITRIINGMLMISRDASREDFTSFNWNDLINDVLNLCGEKFKHVGIEIKIKDGPCLHKEFKGRKIQLSQVILNLLHNSYDAISELSERWIEISCEEGQDSFLIRFTDSGKGIPLELHDRIMQPFFTTKEAGKGTGLGLSLSMSIIKNHNGELYIDKNSSNTSFIIKLPRIV